MTVPLARRFLLVRHADLPGVSGTKVVAEGVEWGDGTVALRWYGDCPTTAICDSLQAVIAVHGHGSSAVVRWLDHRRPEQSRTESTCEPGDLSRAAASPSLTGGSERTRPRGESAL
jgi:hypothetical protein